MERKRYRRYDSEINWRVKKMHLIFSGNINGTEQTKALVPRTARLDWTAHIYDACMDTNVIKMSGELLSLCLTIFAKRLEKSLLGVALHMQTE